MRYPRHPIPEPESPSGLLRRTLERFRPSRLVCSPVIFTTVLLGLATGIFGLGDLIAGGPKPLAVLEMSGTYWLAALLANFIEALAEGTAHNGAGRP